MRRPAGSCRKTSSPVLLSMPAVQEKLLCWPAGKVPLRARLLFWASLTFQPDRSRESGPALWRRIHSVSPVGGQGEMAVIATEGLGFFVVTGVGEGVVVGVGWGCGEKTPGEGWLSRKLMPLKVRLVQLFPTSVVSYCMASWVSLAGFSSNTPSAVLLSLAEDSSITIRFVAISG